MGSSPDVALGAGRAQIAVSIAKAILGGFKHALMAFMQHTGTVSIAKAILGGFKRPLAHSLPGQAGGFNR